MIVLARVGDGKTPVSLAEVTRFTTISRRYLEQVAIGLKRAALIRGVSGRSGGYFLTRPAASITVGEIVEAGIGPISIVDCVLNPAECLKADVCECRWLYQRINSGIVDVLGSVTLQELADRR